MAREPFAKCRRLKLSICHKTLLGLTLYRAKSYWSFVPLVSCYPINFLTTHFESLIEDYVPWELPRPGVIAFRCIDQLRPRKKLKTWLTVT